MSGIVFRGKATSELSATTTTTETRKYKQNKNSEGAAHFLAGFFAVIARRTLSNLIEMAMQSSNDV